MIYLKKNVIIFVKKKKKMIQILVWVLVQNRSNVKNFPKK